MGDVVADALGPGVRDNHPLEVELREEMAAVLVKDLADSLARDVARVVLEVEEQHAGVVAPGVGARSGLGWAAGLRVEHGVGLLEEGRRVAA